MINIICGAISVIIITLFIGGLAQSIWDGTGSVAFPAIAVTVLAMIFFDSWIELRKKS